MEPNECKSSGISMRALHRDIGFFVVGLVVVYALSGITLVYRDVGFLTRDVQVEKKLPPGLEPEELGKALRLKGFSVTKTEGNVIHFPNGTYDKTTGVAVYAVKELPIILQKCVGLHKTVSAKITHWYAVLFAVLLCFLAVSSFWMYPNNPSLLRRGLAIAAAGAVLTAIALFL